jgi:hypothetical protein
VCLRSGMGGGLTRERMPTVIATAKQEAIQRGERLVWVASALTRLEMTAQRKWLELTEFRGKRRKPMVCLNGLLIPELQPVGLLNACLQARLGGGGG